MPTLKNSRRERFAQLLASGNTAKDAYATAGYKASDSNGAWLARKEEISTRVAEISREHWSRSKPLQLLRSNALPSPGSHWSRRLRLREWLPWRQASSRLL